MKYAVRGSNALFLAVAVLGITAWTYIAKLKNELEHSVQQAAKAVEILSDVEHSVLTFRLAERGILLFSNNRNTEKVRVNQNAQVATAVGHCQGAATSRPDRTGASEYARFQKIVAATCAAGKVLEAIQMDADHLVSVGTNRAPREPNGCG